MPVLPTWSDLREKAPFVGSAIRSHMRAIATQASIGSIFFALVISTIAAFVALVATLLAFVFLNDKLLGARASQVFPLPDVSQRSNIYTLFEKPLRLGHLCIKGKPLNPGQSALAISDDGVTSYEFACPKGVGGCWVCQEVVPDTDKGLAAKIRRFMIDHDVWAIVRSSHLFAVIVIATVFATTAATAIFFATFVILTALIFLLIVANSFIRLIATLVRTTRPILLESWIQDDAEPTGCPFAVQLSDFHMTSGEQVPFELEKRSPAPNSTILRNRVSELLAKARSLSPMVLLFSGDLTDSRHELQWESLRQALRLDAGDQLQSIVVPGNHDIQFLIDHAADGTRQGHDQFPPSFDKRQSDCYAQIASTFPDSPAHFPSLTTIVRAEPPIDILAIDSCQYRSNWLLSNSVGKIGEAQLRKVLAILETIEHPLIVLVHHHLGWYKNVERGVDDWMMCATDGGELLEMLARHSSRIQKPVLVVHGHKHMSLSGRYVSTSGTVYVQGAPSSTLGDSASARGRPGDCAHWVRIWLHMGIWRTKVDAMEWKEINSSR